MNKEELMQNRREKFEEYVKQTNPKDYGEYKHKLFQRNGENYTWTWVNWVWQLWNAALDSVVVELPFANDVTHDFGKGYLIGLVHSQKAVHEAGIKTNE